MCGVAGVIVQQPLVATQCVRSMNASQRHRGPDDSGVVSVSTPAGCLALGHRRLAILDLSSEGHQPMHDPRTGNWIVYNGELYNYPELRQTLQSLGHCFRSRCDTEAILYALDEWGVHALDRLNGMFAIAWYDQRIQRLLLARDPLGIKPLYYAINKEAFVFASELRGILASGLIDDELDQQALGGLLAYGAVQEPLTSCRNVRMLPRGSFMELDLGVDSLSDSFPSAQQYWQFPAPASHGSSGQSHEAIRERLDAAVSSHLMSDVPVGVFLSSGLDSSAIAAIAARARGGDVDAFTVCLEQAEELDENPVAERTAQHLGIRQHAICITDQEARQHFEGWLNSVDQPSIDGLNTYIISGAVRERGITVALSGLGGDEIFGGYPSFKQVPQWLRFSQATRWVPSRLRKRLVALAVRNHSASQRSKALDMADSRADLASLYLLRRRLLSNGEMQTLGLSPETLQLGEHFLPKESRLHSFADDPVATISAWESQFYMGNMLLRDSDVQSMAHGLELRVPLLDRSLVDLVCSIGGRERKPGRGPNKRLLAEAVSDLLPSDLMKLKKRGFCLPQAQWMLGPLRERFEHLVAVTANSGLVNPEGVSSLWQHFLHTPHSPNWSRVWLLAVLGHWLEARQSRAGRDLPSPPQSLVA